MKETSVAMAKSVRRWRAERSWKRGPTVYGMVHVGKFWRLTNRWGDKLNFWGPACLTQDRITKIETDLLNRTPRGRELSYGSTLPVTCPRCVKIREGA